MRNTMLAVLMVVAVVAGQIPTDGLVARYDFTGGALTDGSGSGRNLSVYSNWTLTSDRDMFPNNAYLSTGMTGSAFQGQDEGLPVDNSDRSVCFWIDLAEKGDSVQQVITWGSLSSGRDTTNSFRIVFRRDTLCIQERGVRMAKYKVTNGDFPVGGLSQIDNIPWANVTLTVKSDTARWYINGNKKATSKLPVALNTAVATNTNLYIGAAGGGRRLIGKLDEVLIYNRALTDAEVLGVFEPQVSVTTPVTSKRCRPALNTNRVYLIDGRLMQTSPNRSIAVKYVKR